MSFWHVVVKFFRLKNVEGAAQQLANPHHTQAFVLELLDNVKRDQNVAYHKWENSFYKESMVWCGIVLCSVWFLLSW